MRTTATLLTLLLSISTGAMALEGNSSAETSGVAVFDCDRLTWMQDCNEVNRQARQNPDAHLRVLDAEGLEFNFAPGTPAVMMRHMVERTPETARALADHIERHIAVAQDAAALWEAEKQRRGGSLAGTRSNAEIEMIGDITPVTADGVRVFVFYDSRHKETKLQLNAIRRLANRQPDLSISIIQINNNESALTQLNRSYRMNATLLRGERRAELLKQIKTTPSVWVQFPNKAKNYISNGYISAEELEAAIRRVSR